EGVFAVPPLAATLVSLDKATSGLPFNLSVWVPEAAGTYPTVVFLPGFGVGVERYAAMLQHVAGYGAVVVAVQLESAVCLFCAGAYPGEPRKATTADEAALLPAVFDFVGGEFRAVVDDAVAGVALDGQAPVLAGHSRGGKVAWRVLTATASAASGLALLDPVDAPPPALAGITDPNAVVGPLSFTAPALILGTGLGPTGLPPCAPDGDNHGRFADALVGAVHVVDAAAGHNDVLDNPGFACRAGSNATGLRTTAAGLVVATVRESRGEAGALRGAVAGAPVALSEP
ncbi:MAG: hypothetical protein FJ137_20090, partial [Deltaproteobacteria bacterium]|nr:hypothetical protein [Deltaproteobacteria bacterium]